MMRRIRTTLLSAVAVCLSLPLAAQKPRLLRFDEPVQRLDTVREADGAVRLRYAFTNISPKPVTLLDVHTQCGCFTPSWDRKPVPPGGRGVVEAVFDPKNRLHDFSIGLTVIATDGDYRKFNTLKVTGYVVSRIPEEEIFYPYVLSDAFRADVDAVGMRRFVPGDGPRERAYGSGTGRDVRCTPFTHRATGAFACQGRPRSRPARRRSWSMRSIRAAARRGPSPCGRRSAPKRGRPSSKSGD